MREFRVTKYNPIYRDAQGRYRRNEWTSYRDIGKNVTLTEYEETESAYIDTALSMLKEQNIFELKITHLENSNTSDELGFQIGTVLSLEVLRKIISNVLREQYWVKLESDKAFIHFGYDYNMYVGIPSEPKQAVKLAKSRGLFVEPFSSPYK